MTTDELVSTMRTVLAAERDAIRRLDSKAVGEAARTKEELLATISGATGEDRRALLQGLALVRDELHRNLVLLAHARDCVREAITFATPSGTGPGARVSIQL